MKKRFTLLICALLAAACTQNQPPADPSVITSRADAWDAALTARDTDALVALYTADARVMPPNEKMSRGTEAVRAAFGAMIDAGISGELTTIEANVSGDVGYRVGSYQLMADGGVVDTGKFVETWRRGEDGVWRIANDIWNSDGQPGVAAGDRSHIVILHEVEDFDRWIAAWRGDNSRHQLFEANGAAHVHTMQNQDSPNEIGLIISATDADALFEMIESDEGMAAAAEDGVVSDTIVVLTEVE